MRLETIYRFFSKITIFILLFVFTSELTELTINILDLFLPMIENSLRITSTYNIVVENECNGQYLLLFFIFVSLFYNFKLSYTLFILLIIYVVNIFRIFLIYKLLLIFGNESFIIIHDLIGNIISISSILIPVYILKLKRSLVCT